MLSACNVWVILWPYGGVLFKCEELCICLNTYAGVKQLKQVLIVIFNLLSGFYFCLSFLEECLGGPKGPQG